MAGIGDLLSVLMQGGLSPNGTNRVGSAMSGIGQSGGILGQVLGGAGSSGGGGLLGGLMQAAQDMLPDAGSPSPRGKTLATGGLGALAGALLGGGSGSVKGALGGGGLALLAGLALQAFQNANRQPAGMAMGLAGDTVPLGMRAPANSEEEQALQSTAELAFRGMLNAAKADGKIDAAEREKLASRLNDAALDEQDRQRFLEELQQPLDLDGLVAAIPNEAVAAQVYAASLFAITVDTPAERDYLAQLAQRTGLDQEVVQQLHMAVGLA